MSNAQRGFFRSSSEPVPHAMAAQNAGFVPGGLDQGFYGGHSTVNALLDSQVNMALNTSFDGAMSAMGGTGATGQTVSLSSANLASRNKRTLHTDSWEQDDEDDETKIMRTGSLGTLLSSL
jgi:hypothetical protein